MSSTNTNLWTRNSSYKRKRGDRILKGCHGGVRCVLLPLSSCSDPVCVCSAGSQTQPAVCCLLRRTRGGEDQEGTKGKRGWKGEPLAGHKEMLGVGVGGRLLLGVLLPQRWQLKGTRERENEWIWMREDGCPSTGPPWPSRGTDPLFLCLRLPLVLFGWVNWQQVGAREHIHICMRTHTNTQTHSERLSGTCSHCLQSRPHATVSQAGNDD